MDFFKAMKEVSAGYIMKRKSRSELIGLCELYINGENVSYVGTFKSAFSSKPSKRYVITEDDLDATDFDYATEIMKLG